ncbi:glycosyltransferase family 4 protein [Dyadobacter aurulentus]|uniref:glycosyltransferase family 4 protein n=1 Tax=Dyadobacter sp. UC 10 TaxID=2605428 RepID=UPI0011F19D81|nr:glycosyltransferase family 1 protein [Dyadobacter sp. UC 10]KAA0991444.1 glycosyltransferase family 4 protein [Dyadobacter sp. UC 10]
MRIGFDAKRAFANKTGLGNYSRFVLEALTRYEDQNEYFAYTPKNKQNLFPSFPVEAVRLPESWLDKQLSSYWRYANISSQLSKEGIQVFHGLSNEIPLGLAHRNISSVVTIHDLIFEKLPHLFKPADRLIYRHKFRSACDRADRVIAVSEQTKRDLVELYKVENHKIDVIYQDCSPIFRNILPQAARDEILALYDIQMPYVLCVGTLEERKNQHRLVEAFAGIDQKDSCLILIGKPTGYLNKINETIAKYKLQNRVKILQNVPSEHLPAIYQRAEVFAYISVYEGFGIPILEALHSETPVLSARGSCLEEAGGAGGLYANPLKTEEVSHQLNRLLTDHSLRYDLVEAGKRHIEQFEAQKIAAQLSDLYKKIAQ